MSVTVRKNPQESSERLIARFNKKVQQSRIMILVRAKRYRSKSVKPRLVRMVALKRTEYRSLKQKAKFL